MTVQDLIDRLENCKKDLPVVLEDADTDWIGPQIHIVRYENAIVMRIEYHEMDHDFSLGRLLGYV